MLMVQDKARVDEQKLIDKNYKKMADLSARFEREKQQLLEKLDEQHRIEMARLEKMWSVRSEVSQNAVKSLNNDALAASVVDRQQRILQKASYDAYDLGPAAMPYAAMTIACTDVIMLVMRVLARVFAVIAVCALRSCCAMKSSYRVVLLCSLQSFSLRVLLPRHI